MIPALIAVFGPWKGKRIELVESETIIGRDKSSRLWISDLMLSRRHCAIRRDGELCTIADLGSRNGVFVNGLPARERVLEHADRIEIGNSLFVFVSREEEATITSEHEEEELESRSTLTLKVTDDPNYAEAASRLRVHPNYLYRLVRNLGLEQS